MSDLTFAFTKNGTQYRGVEDVPQGLTKTSSTVVRLITRDPEIIRLTEKQMLTRSKYNSIINYGIPSCQLTRTYGLIVYALSNFGIDIDLDNNTDETIHLENMREILTLFYPDIILSEPPLYVDDIDSESLEYLRFALSFSDLNQVSRRMEINSKRINYDYSDYFSVRNNYFDTIHTFAIIKHSPDGELPIHYFNIVRSITLRGKICCYSSWGSDTISVEWSRFIINFKILSNIKTLLDLMIDPENVFFKSTTIPAYKESLGNFDNLYVIEILNPEGEPLVNTVEKVLEYVVPHLRRGGSNKNKNKKRKIYNRKSNKKRTKKVRKTYKKR